MDLEIAMEITNFMLEISESHGRVQEGIDRRVAFDRLRTSTSPTGRTSFFGSTWVASRRLWSPPWCRSVWDSWWGGTPHGQPAHLLHQKKPMEKWPFFFFLEDFLGSQVYTNPCIYYPLVICYSSPWKILENHQAIQNGKPSISMVITSFLMVHRNRWFTY